MARAAGADDHGAVGYVQHLQAGRAAMAAGEWTRAHDELTSAREEQETAEVLDHLGAVAWWSGDVTGSVRLRERAYAAHLHDRAPAAAALVAVDLAVCHLTNLDDVPVAQGWIARARRLADQAGDRQVEGWVALVEGYTTDGPAGRSRLGHALDVARDRADLDLELVALADLGLAMVSGGEVAGGLGLLDEAMAGTLGGGYRRLETVVWTSCSMLAACSLVGDLQRAARWCSEADRFAVRYGCPFLQARCRSHYGRVLVATGQWEAAEAELAAALAMTENVGSGPRAEARTGLAELRVRQGRPEEAAVLLEEVDDDVLAAVVAAEVELARGRPDLAVSLARSRVADLDPSEPDHPLAAAALVDALLAAGDLAGAVEEAQRLQQAAVGHGHPQAAALASRAAGRVEVASSRPAEAARLLRSALRSFQELDLPFDVARTRLLLAEALAGDDPVLAVAEAQRALRRFEELGAASYADAAAALLRRLGVRTPPGPRGPDPLSQREQEVLDLVAQGLSNPEIGARLFISRKTAAHHVSSILTKLGLGSRAEAAAYAARRRPARSDGRSGGGMSPVRRP